VRQGTDAQGDLVSAWLFDPDGAVLEGPGGPVSHLVCGGVYDWSTGLLYKSGRYFDPSLGQLRDAAIEPPPDKYKSGRYFDPSLGIWLALLPLIVVRRKKKRRGFPWVVVLALCLGGMSGVLTACGPGDGGTLDREFLKSMCVDVPSPDDFELSVTLHTPSKIVGQGSAVGGALIWQARLGEHDPQSPEQAGAYIKGRYTSKDSTSNGEVKFVQYVAFREEYTFKGESPIIFGDKEGELDQWYLDKADPYSGYTRSGSCGSGGFWGYIFDSPGSELQFVRAGGGDEKHPPLIRYVREEKFQTYLLWYPLPSDKTHRVPIAVVEWSWKAEANATEYPNPWNVYPWEWNGELLYSKPTIGESKPGEKYTNSELPPHLGIAPTNAPFIRLWESSDG